MNENQNDFLFSLYCPILVTYLFYKECVLVLSFLKERFLSWDNKKSVHHTFCQAISESETRWSWLVAKSHISKEPFIVHSTFL